MVKRLQKIFFAYGRQFLAEVLGRSLRGSLLIGGAIMLLSHTGWWLYAASSLAAHDMQRSAAWAADTTGTDVVVVGIDDVGYEGYFKGRSPLDRAALRDFLAVVDASVPPQATLVLDLDLSPSVDEDPALLMSLWKGAAPHRWVLAAPGLQMPDPQPGRQQWREAVCALGVRFGFPYLPSEFGYASSTHQFQGSLTDVARSTEPGCQRWQSVMAHSPGRDGSLQLPRWPAPMDGAMLKNGLVLPFQGDLELLRSTLAQLAPQVVVIGGMWGPSDVFITPFGERFGVQLHAAAIQGQRLGQWLAPYWLQVLMAWLSVACLTLALGWLYRGVARHVEPWAEQAPGHRFLRLRVWPITMTVLTVLAALLVSEALALLHARTGLWVPTAAVVFVMLTTMLFTWNWGLNGLQMYGTVREAWKGNFAEPVRQDWNGLRRALRIVADGASAAPATMSRRRAVLEAVSCGVALLGQTLLPVAALILTLTKPL